MRPGDVPLFRVTFTVPNGTSYRMDTTDPAKIGPWLAELFGLFPYDPTWGPSSPVDIKTGSVVRY